MLEATPYSVLRALADPRRRAVYERVPQTFVLEPIAGGTRLRPVDAGFKGPRNEVAFKNMNDGWQKVIGNIGTLAES